MRVLALCVLHFVSVAAHEKVTVSTLYGSINGFKYSTEDGKDANVFLGIPFAKPPIGDLRFERPELPDPWKEPLEATEFAHSCSPHHRSGIPGEHSEDCLYLNVIAPAQESNNPAGHAVMVWIHGGGYCVGTAKTYGYTNISENFATRNVIVVSIQYRLGPLGWASSGNRVMPGNIGYWDQRAAVRFVKENIASFGGDPNRITLFGLSAGGGSASSLSLSPHTRDLFSQTIEMSGSAFAPWAASESVIASTAALAIALDCPIADSDEMKECFKSKTTDELFDAVDATGAAQRKLNILKFGPVIDGDFFPYDFERLVEDSPSKPTIIGLVNKESAFFTTEGNLKPINQIRIEPEDYAKYGEDDLVAFINDVVVPEKLFGKRTNELRKLLIEHYANEDAPDDKDYKFYLERYTELVSDAVFNVPCLRMKTSKVANGWPVWFYFNDHHNVGAFSDDAPVKGATHLHEYPYMFGVSPFYNFVVNEEEIKLRTAIVETFTHFAKYGKPGTTEYPWDPVTKENPQKHMRFNPEAKMQEGFLQRTVAFWESLGESGKDIIRGWPRPHGRLEDEL